NAHPDEWVHVAAAQYYVDHWIRSPIGSPDLEPAVTKDFGHSYLFELDMVYFVAGKLTESIRLDSYFRLRLFNVALYAILIFTALFYYQEAPALALVLGISPQIWYVFSYFNGDAFPLFISLLAALLLVRIVRREGGGLTRSRAVILGLLCGMLAISKTNYLILVPFFFAIALLKLAKLSVPGLAKLSSASLDQANLRALGI